jgi:aspartyl-tRNA(Asn)/glutamyl-tRNA(Gln) amidotransferase subunit B
MRVKETADDYRLFPEPDLAPYDLSDEFIARVKARLPELPDAKKQRFIATYDLPYNDAVNLSSDVELARFFDEALAVVGAEDVSPATPVILSEAKDPADDVRTKPDVAVKSLAKPIANLLLNDVSAYLNANNLTLPATKLTPPNLAELAQLVADDTISSKQAKEVFALTAQTGDAPAAIVEQKGMKQVSDSGAIEELVAKVIAANSEKVAEYQSGKTGLLGFFVGAVMRETAGQGNPKLINEILRKHLES